MSRGPEIHHPVALPGKHFIYVLNLEVMMGQFELVFSRIKEFHLRIKLKKCHVLTPASCSWTLFSSVEGISANPENVKKVRNLPSL